MMRPRDTVGRGDTPEWGHGPTYPILYGEHVGN